MIKSNKFDQILKNVYSAVWCLIYFLDYILFKFNQSELSSDQTQTFVLLLIQGHLIKYIDSFTRHRDILQGKNSQRKFSNVFISLFIITKLFSKSESLLLFKLNKLIGQKPIPATTNPVWKFSLRNFCLQDVPVPFYTTCISNVYQGRQGGAYKTTLNLENKVFTNIYYIFLIISIQC